MRFDSNALARGRAAASLAGLVGVALAAGSFGFWIGQQGPSANQPTITSQPSDQPSLDAMAVRVGQMQAELTRINSLGQRLSELSGLDQEGYDFKAPAGAGGGPERVSLRSNNPSDVSHDLAKVLGELDDRNRKLALLETLIRDRDLKGGRAAIPGGWPLAIGGVITSGFGYRRHPISGRSALHMGTDISGPVGTSIVAMAEGVVIFSGQKNGYGNIVELRHSNGIETRYAHCQQNLVQVGDTVHKGQVIAKLGSTGRSTGPHVHFEVRRNGSAVDPISYLDSGRSRLARL